MGYRKAAKMDRSPMAELRALRRPNLRSYLYRAQRINVIIVRSHTLLRLLACAMSARDAAQSRLSKRTDKTNAFESRTRNDELIDHRST